MSEEQEQKMEYGMWNAEFGIESSWCQVRLGKSGLKVSKIIL